MSGFGQEKRAGVPPVVSDDEKDGAEGEQPRLKVADQSLAIEEVQDRSDEGVSVGLPDAEMKKGKCRGAAQEGQPIVESRHAHFQLPVVRRPHD